MDRKINRLAIRPTVLFIILLIAIGLLTFRYPLWNIGRSVQEKLLAIRQLRNLDIINRKMKNNYLIAQRALMAKIWQSKFAMFQDKDLIQYIGAENMNTRLSFEAGRIARECNVRLQAEYALLPYLYKGKNEEITIGFIALDCAGIERVGQNY